MSWMKLPGNPLHRQDSYPVPGEFQKEKESLEPLYRVIIHNDEVTPMVFVIHVLINVFFLGHLQALQVMYTAHFHGSAYVQTLPKSEAVKRVGMAHTSARLNGFPLQFSLEAE
jgi:ATP-dependent Clp protease adaptor protein ClpS